MSPRKPTREARAKARLLDAVDHVTSNAMAAGVYTGRGDKARGDESMVYLMRWRGEVTRMLAAYRRAIREAK
jgi:fructose-1,6-bisphosphatase/sedoheptulose 1,7-bisphosphatase-like protein